MVVAHPLHNIIIGGDFNTELKDESPFDQFWFEIMAKYNLECCDKLIPGTANNTPSHDSLGQRKWNDHNYDEGFEAN